MGLSLHRFPRETRVAAVVLGAALVLVGTVSAVGLRSASERRQTFERELADAARPVVRNVVNEATARVAEAEARLERELSRAEDKSAWERVAAAMDARAAPLFEYAYLVDGDGRVVDWRCAPYAESSASSPDAAARALLDEALRLESADPVRAGAMSRALAEQLGAAPRRDDVALALALRTVWRTAFARQDWRNARAAASALLDGRLRDVRDDRGPIGEAEPLGPAASAVLCDVLYRSLVAAPMQGEAFVDAVIDRRVQAQRLRPLLSEAAYRVEVDECEALARNATMLAPRLRAQLRDGLEKRAVVDQAQQRVESLGRRTLAAAAKAPSKSRLVAESRWLVAVIPTPPAAGARADGPVAAAFVAPPSALKAEALDPATRALALPEGLALVVRDESGRDLLGGVDGAALPGSEDVSFGAALPGLHANVALVDSAVVERESASARRLWLAILAGAAMAALAASVLAIRAVLREVRLARMKSDFVSNLSHELRTPLTSLRMFVEMLRDGRVRDEAEAKECLDVVAQETDRLQSLVERVLQFASFTRGRAPIDLRSGDVGAVARRAVQLFAKRAEAARASIDLVVEDDLPESILDRDAVLQVFLNLLDNAVKYAGHDGARIRVGVRSLGPAGTADAGVAIEVEDDGPGVPERERDLVFEEFYRGDDTLSRRVEGTGIGLAVARRIVLAHGGRIAVARSERLGGAAFRVALPAASAGRRLALAAGKGAS
jgi:signal transduction histidine kinase